MRPIAVPPTHVQSRADDLTGAVITHELRIGDIRFRKGQRITADDLPILVQSDLRIHAVILDDDDVYEDDAAIHLAALIRGDGIIQLDPVQSRVNLVATGGGFDAPLRFHRVDEEQSGPIAPINTTLGVIATNAALTKPQLIKVADLAHNGFARAIRPMHPMLDGDTIFTIRPNDNAIEPPDTTDENLTDLVGAAAADAMVLAIINSAQGTEGVEGWRSVKTAQQAIRELHQTTS